MNFHIGDFDVVENLNLIVDGNPVLNPYALRDKEPLGCASGAAPSSFTLEQHLIIRFLEDDVADRVRQLLRNDDEIAISSKKSSPMRINIDSDLRNAQIEIEGIGLLKGRIFDMPNIIESQKTLNGYLFHKSSNASQILVCTKDESLFDELDSNFTLFNHGITPPMYNSRSTKFRKPVKKSNDSYFVESEVKRLIMHDKNALSFEWEVINDDENDDNNTNSSNKNQEYSRDELQRQNLDNNDDADQTLVADQDFTEDQTNVSSLHSTDNDQNFASNKEDLISLPINYYEGDLNETNNDNDLIGEVSSSSDESLSGQNTDFLNLDDNSKNI